MAIVANKDGMGISANGFVGNVDKGYAAPNRTASGIPTGASQYASEVMSDSATGFTYRAMATGTTAWVNF